MKDKILFIYPPSPIMNREDRCQQPTDDLLVIPPLPPSDLLYMASIARMADFDPVVKDYSLDNLTIEDLKKDILEINPKYIVANVTSTEFESDMLSINAAKEVKSDIITVVKGAHFRICDQISLKKYDSLDIVIRGEVEFTLLDILKGTPLNEILGITYKSGDKIMKNPDRPFIENLDEIPYPARDLIDNSFYKRPDTGEVQAVIKVSRGCPHHCFFCLATPVSGAKVRMRSVENIMGEIRECVEKYGIKNFIFWSDLFNFDSNWVKNLCNAIISSGLNITYSTNTRADTADFETAQLMKLSGCKLVSIGVESGSDMMLEKIGKHLTRADIIKTVKMFKKLGVKIYAYYVIGLPWEDINTFKETLNFAKYLNTEYASFYTATALIGTRFYDYVMEHKLAGLNFDKPYYYPSVQTHFLDKDTVFKLHKRAHKEYYCRLRYIFMMLSKIKSFDEFKNYFKAGLKLLSR